MIDTITIRLSNVKSYPITKLRFEQTSKDGQTVVQVDEDSGECFTSTEIRALLHHDTNNIIPLTKRNSVYEPSSNYKLLYKYNIVADCIDFEFSIPKYIYGSNIIQFVRYFGQDNEAQYKHLMAFIKSFINKMTYEPINMIDVSIRRLDFCYNQFFASKYDAMKYLNEQKELLPKYARSTKNDFRSYESSLMYTTKRYSFKIYHKGTEFQKHDKVKLADRNPTGENIDDLQAASDRILRYEVTFRKAQFDYLFREKELYKEYVKFFFNESARKSFKLMQPRFYEDILKFCERGHDYVCAPVVQATAIRTTQVFFSQALFNELYKFFWDYCNKFQLQCKMSVMDVIQKVDEANSIRDTVGDQKLRDKLSYNKNQIVTLALLTQFYSLDQLRKSKLLADSTFYRYQAQLKKLGFVSEGRLVDIAPPSLDYLEYLSIFGKHHLK